VDEEQTPQERALQLVRWLLPNWRPSEKQILWVIRIAVVVAIVLGVLALIGNSFGITLWDWLKVLAVPITLGVAVPVLNWLQKKRELEVAKQDARDRALQAYLDQMSQLLLDKFRPLSKAQQGSAVSTVARARTLAVLRIVDPHGKRKVLDFLVESKLIEWSPPKPAIINLGGYDTLDSAADLSEAHLKGISLNSSDVSGSNLKRANLEEADLREANLSGTDLKGANLSGAHLEFANLGSAQDITNEELEQQAFSLIGVTMPNGQKYEDWLKDKKAQGKDVKNE
jgi:hypothetical protein